MNLVRRFACAIDRLLDRFLQCLPALPPLRDDATTANGDTITHGLRDNPTEDDQQPSC